MTDEDIFWRAVRDVLYALQDFAREVRRYLRRKWRGWKYPR